MNKKAIRNKILICLVLILVVVANFFSLARYRSAVTGLASGKVAKWDNNIVIVGDNSLILDNNSVNSDSISFNVVSNSEVSSMFHIGIDEVPEDITLVLSNSSNTGGIFVSGSSITIKMGLEEQTFTIPSTATTTTTGNITMTSTVISGGIKLEFTQANSNMEISVVKMNNEDTVNTIFSNFGTISYGNNQSVNHTLSFSTTAIYLPGMSELEIYAVLEQID